MNEIDFLASEITSRYGTVKRARSCFLYTAKGKRLTDLFQEGGRAILGWGGSSAFTVLKDVLGRGITGSFDTDFTPRAVSSLGESSPKSQLSRAVSELLASERAVYIFSSKAAALKAALELFPSSTSVYRPWASESPDWRKVDAVILEPPLPWASSLWLLALKEDFPGVSSERISAPLCAAITRSVYNLIKALQEREEKHWFIYDTVLTKYFTRRGPYLYPTVAEERYADFVIHCLDQGIVISPIYSVPSIVPFGADKGVFRALEKHPFQ